MYCLVAADPVHRAHKPVIYAVYELMDIETEARLFLGLPKSGLLDGLAGFRCALGQLPYSRRAATAYHHLRTVGATAVYDASCGDKLLYSLPSYHTAFVVCLRLILWSRPCIVKATEVGHFLKSATRSPHHPLDMQRRCPK